MNSRTAILARLQRTRHAGIAAAVTAPEPAGDAAIATRARQPEERTAQIERFMQLAAATRMSTQRVGSASEIPAAVGAYLGQSDAQRRVVVDALLDIADEDWGSAGLQWSRADTNPDGDVYVRKGLAAIVECGAVVIASGAGRSLRNDFLAHTHIVVVSLEQLLPTFSALWEILRAQQADLGIAREVCLITGPSRTADLGVPAKLGAHGPARVHVVLVDIPDRTFGPT